jgi:radical SAM superfamily enzyme YgiQ (UPF0313 family)
MQGGIVLAAINAKWIHPALSLRLLKANLGPLEEYCSIMEFALRQPLREKIEAIAVTRPRILGLSVSIWNHSAALELLKELHQTWGTGNCPVIVIGGPEVSYLPREAEIFCYADYCVLGEGETAFRELCETIFEKGEGKKSEIVFVNRDFQQVDVNSVKSAYHLYSDEDIRKKLIYVEASRGCAFGCEFCQSTHSAAVREFLLEPFLAEMGDLIRRGTKTFKFLDRSFNLNIERARRIMGFFLEKIEEQTEPFIVHFEMVPSRFPPELIETIARFPPGTLRLEIGIQTLNPETAARIGRPSKPDQELAVLARLREKTSAIIHADLIAGLPGEDMASFGRGFDLLVTALHRMETRGPAAETPEATGAKTEIQLGILKLLPGTPIARHTVPFGMRYNPLAPYEVIETAAIPVRDLNRVKNFARFWEIIVNREFIPIDAFRHSKISSLFDRFMALSDALFARFGRNWGIDKHELLEAIHELYQ